MLIFDIAHTSPDFFVALRQRSFRKSLVLCRPVSILDFHRLPTLAIGPGLQGLWDMTLVLAQSKGNKIKRDLICSVKRTSTFITAWGILVCLLRNPSVNFRVLRRETQIDVKKKIKKNLKMLCAMSH